MSELSNAIKLICDEKGLAYEAVIETIESALAAAYRKDFGHKNQNIKVEFNEEIAKSKIFDVKTIVEDLPEEEEKEEDDPEAAPKDEPKMIEFNTWELKHINEEDYDNILNEKKTIEVRAGKEEGAEKDWRAFKENDVINFMLVSPEDEKLLRDGLKCRIVRIAHYPSLEDLLDKESIENITPGKTSKEFFKQTEKFIGYKERIKNHGVWAFELEPVVEERKFNPKTEMQLSDARMIKKTVKLDDELKIKLDPPENYGRMAAQTAKQVIIQRLREAEREMVYNDFKEKEGEVVSGVVQRHEGKMVLVDLGKSTGILLPDEQIPTERYLPNERIKVYVKSVELKPKGPEIVLSRISNEILKKIFYLEIPEIANGLIELKNVAREAGQRAKVAVFTDSENVDPIGSCVGQRGARIQTIISELGGEKVDIIEYDDDPIKYISNALSPAKVANIDTYEEQKKAIVWVSGDQLSLAIGKSGQNARLAAKLTGWRIDIKEAVEKKADAEKDDEVGEDEDEKSEKKEKREDENKKDEKSEKCDKKNEKSKKNEKKEKGEDKSKKDEKKKEDKSKKNEKGGKDKEDKGGKDKKSEKVKSKKKKENTSEKKEKREDKNKKGEKSKKKEEKGDEKNEKGEKKEEDGK